MSVFSSRISAPAKVFYEDLAGNELVFGDYVAWVFHDPGKHTIVWGKIAGFDNEASKVVLDASYEGNSFTSYRPPNLLLKINQFGGHAPSEGIPLSYLIKMYARSSSELYYPSTRMDALGNPISMDSIFAFVDHDHFVLTKAVEENGEFKLTLISGSASSDQSEDIYFNQDFSRGIFLNNTSSQKS